MKTILIPVVAKCPKHGMEYFNLKIVTEPTLSCRSDDTKYRPIYNGKRKVLTGLEVGKNVTFEEALEKLAEKAKAEAKKMGYTIETFNGRTLQ